MTEEVVAAVREPVTRGPDTPAVEDLIERLRKLDAGLVSCEEHLSSGTPEEPPVNEAMMQERYRRLEQGLTTISGMLLHLGY